MQLLLRLVEQIAAGPFDERQILFRPTLILVVLEHHRGKIHAREHIAEPRRKAFLLLQVPAKRQHRDVGRERERRAESIDVLIEALRGAGVGHAREAGERQGHDERAHCVADRKADMAEQRLVEFPKPLRFVLLARGLHFAQHERMTPDRALAEDDETARQYVRAFHRDRDGHDLIAAREVVLRPQANALAAMHVHRIVRNEPAELGEVVLQHRGRHRRFLAAVDCARGHRSRGVHDVSTAGHAREHFRNAFELTDGQIELTTNARVRTRGKHGGLRTASCTRGQRDAASDGQLLDEHAPALACHLRAADDGIERHEHVFALNRPVLERHVQREMPAPNRNAGRVAWNQGASDAVLHALAAEQAFRVIQLECKPDDGRDRRERDVALGEVEPHADDFAPVVDALAHDARIGN